MEFPVKADFFPAVKLTSDERAKYARVVESSASALRRAVDAHDWIKVADKDGVAFSKMHAVDYQQQPMRRTANATGAATACIAVCATIFTPGTISEVLEAIASPVTEDYRKAMAFLYKSRFLDAVGLQTLPATTPQAFTTLKWAAFDDGRNSNSAKFPLGSDYCFLEHSGITHTHDGDAFGFSLQESIVRDREVPSLGGFGLRRGEFHRTGFIVLPTDRRDVVQVSSILQMQLLGSDSSANKAALERLMLKRVSAVGRIDVLLERRRLSKMQFVARDAWVADEDRRACAVCVKPFSLRRRHHCRNCGEVVCSTCAPPREVDVLRVGAALIRICTACVVHARSEQQSQPQLAGSSNAAAAAGETLVFHVRTTLSSRASSASSDAAAALAEGNDAFHGAAAAATGSTMPMLRATRRFSTDSNFSIANEYDATAQSAAAARAQATDLSNYYYEQMQYQNQNQYLQHDSSDEKQGTSEYQYEEPTYEQLLQSQHRSQDDGDNNNNQQQQQQQQFSLYNADDIGFDFNEYEEEFDVDDDHDAIDVRASQARSSTSSSYSFSDLNTFDDRFGSIALKRLAPQQQSQRLPPPTNTNTRHMLYHAPQQPQQQQQQQPTTTTSLGASLSAATDRSVYNPAKVQTHLLTLEPLNQQTNNNVRSTDDEVEDDEDFHKCIRGLQNDLSRATTAATTTSMRFSDLLPTDSFCSDVHTNSFSCEWQAPQSPQSPDAERPRTPPSPPASPSNDNNDASEDDVSPLMHLLLSSATLVVPTSVDRQDSTSSSGSSASSSPSTVDADIELLLLNDDFSLLCPDTLQRERERCTSTASSTLSTLSFTTASRRQDAGERRRHRVISNVSLLSSQSESPLRESSSGSRFSSGSVLDDDDEEEEEEEEDEGDDHNDSSNSLDSDDDSDVDGSDDNTENTSVSHTTLASHADLLALQRQVEGLSRSLEDATSKLQYFQSRSAMATAAAANATKATKAAKATKATRSQRTVSIESDLSTTASAAVAPLPMASSRSSSVRASRRSARRRTAPVTAIGSSKDGAKRPMATANGSTTTGSRSSRRRATDYNVDPMTVRRTETYDALVSELHELMGLPTLASQQTSVVRGC